MKTHNDKKTENVEATSYSLQGQRVENLCLNQSALESDLPQFYVSTSRDQKIEVFTNEEK